MIHTSAYFYRPIRLCSGAIRTSPRATVPPYTSWRLVCSDSWLHCCSGLNHSMFLPQWLCYVIFETLCATSRYPGCRRKMEFCSSWPSLIGNNLIVLVFTLTNDFKVLGLNLPSQQIIDIQQHYSAMQSAKELNLPTLLPGASYGLSSLAEHVLCRSIQNGPHNALEDARATMAQFKVHRERNLETCK